jgi:hypothetical protein
MGLLDINTASTTGQNDISYSSQAVNKSVNEWSVTPKELDSPGDQKTTTYDFFEWNKWNGYYREIAEFGAVIDKMASWTVGKGYEADEKTQKILKKIKGWGKDDFNSILENQLRVALVNGDSFAEIIKDKAGRLINLKPMNPGSMQIIVDRKGMLKNYIQKSTLEKFEPEEIFHLSWNREADEIHGIPFGEKVEPLLKMRIEAMKDLKIVFHRYVKPLILTKIDSDDTNEIATFKTKLDNAVENCENLIIPKDIVEMERMSIPQYSTLDPLPWLKYLIRVFTTASGMPEVIMGWGEETTEASAKILYLAFQQTIERLQRYVESQLLMQTKIEINLEFPASIEPEAEQTKAKTLSSDEKKDGKINPKQETADNHS